MAAEDDGIVESALQHLGSVAERLDHYVPPAEGQPPDPTGYGLLDPKSSTSPAASKKRVKGDGTDGDEKKPKKTRQTQSCDGMSLARLARHHHTFFIHRDRC
jgi:hypothetical protein